MAKEIRLGVQIEKKIFLAWAEREGDGRAIGDDPIRAGSEKLVIGGGGAKRNDTGAGGLASANARGSVFNDNALFGRESETRGTFQIRLRIGLAVLNIVGGDELPGNGQSRGADTHVGEGPGARGDDSPAPPGERLEKLHRSGQGNNTFDVENLLALNFGVFRLMVGIGEKFADGGDTGAAVSAAHGVFGVEAMGDSPLVPDAGDGGSGINENAVEVEEQTTALDGSHGDYDSRAAGSVR
jgi:hypothetical protein